MSSRLLFTLSVTMRAPVAVVGMGGCLVPYLVEIGHGVIIKIGFIGSVLPWWTSRDLSGISGLCSGRFDLHHGHHPAKPESARTSFGLRSGSGHF
jgi:hypothetical protein